MFEQRHQPYITHTEFLWRFTKHFALAVGVIALSLLIGMLGYRFLAHLSWVDSFLNAAMILSGMGPVDEVHGNTAKVFAGCYALFSGVVFLTTAAILFAPLVHRLLHHFHLMDRHPPHQEQPTASRAANDKS